jgi:hypothetical protein
MTNELITGEVFGQERDAPRAHLLTEAEKTFSQLREPYLESHVRLLGVLDGVSDTQARFLPGTGEGEDAWGIAQIVGHLAGSEARMAKRIRNLGLGEEMGAPMPQPEEETRSIQELKAALEEAHRLVIEAGSACDGKEGLEKIWNHPFFGGINCRAVFALQTLHENDHARQIARIKALPAYPRE